jgi:hypothetical protein
MKKTMFFVGILALAAISAYPDTGAKVVDAHGTVEKRVGSAGSSWQSVNVGDMLSSGSAIRTGEDSAVLIQLPDKHAFRVGEGTTVELREVGANRSFSFQVLKGTIWSFVNKSKKPAKYEVETPSMVLGVSGTLFSVSHDELAGASDISVDDGEVRVRQGGTTHRMERGWQIRLMREQVEAVRPQRHDNQTREMWRNMRDREGWTRPVTIPRLSPQTEQRLRDLNRQRLELQRQQELQREQDLQRRRQAETVRPQPAQIQRQQNQRVTEPVKAAPSVAPKTNTAPARVVN